MRFDAGRHCVASLGSRPHRVKFISLAVVALAAVLARPAYAHPESAPALVNRYITVATQDETAFVSVALLFGAQPGTAVRRHADLDGDGTVDSREERALRGRYQSQAPEWLQLLVDGAPVAFAPRLTLDLGASRGAAAGALVAEATMRVPLRGVAPHEILVIPKAHPAPQGETEVTAVLGPGWRLRDDGRQQRSVKVLGPTLPGFSVNFKLERRAARSALMPWAIVLPSGMLALGVWLWRRQRHRAARAE